MSSIGYIPTDVKCEMTSSITNSPSDELSKEAVISWYFDNNILSNVKCFEISCNCTQSGHSIFVEVWLCFVYTAHTVAIVIECWLHLVSSYTCMYTVVANVVVFTRHMCSTSASITCNLAISYLVLVSVASQLAVNITLHYTNLSYI